MTVTRTTWMARKIGAKGCAGAWNTPIVIEVDGHSELVATLPRRVSAFDPATGERLWTCGGAARWLTRRRLSPTE